MLQPTRTKYRKVFKGRNDGLSWNGAAVSFGEFGLKATSHGQLTARQIEAARRSISRYVKRGGKMWIRVFPDKPITTPGRAEWIVTRADFDGRSIRIFEMPAWASFLRSIWRTLRSATRYWA